MGQLSSQGSNAIIYLSYAFLLFTGLFIAWKWSSKSDFLSNNGSQRAIPLALNFIASAMGCGILTTYTQIANISGLHGLLVYTICGSIPILGFGFLGPIIRKKCPEGFVFTEWVRQRYGAPCGLYLSFWTCLTMFLFMIGELSAIRSAIETLTGLNALGAVIVECVVTSIYTSVGGFKVSFVTDNFQGVCVLLLIIICACGMGSYIDIDTSKVGPSKLLDANKLGWQLLYILFVAIVTNDCFMAGFWLRTFASKSNKDLLIGSSIATFVTFAICTLVGVPGFLAVWSGDLTVNDPNGYLAFYILLLKMPKWLVGFTIIFVVFLSTCTFDSLQSAMVSTISNDLFRNKLPLIYVRAGVFLIMVPIVVLAIKVADNILQIYLIADLVSAATIPIVLLGLWDKGFWFLRGIDIIIGSLGAFLGVFVFGTVYYNSAKEGGKLLLIWNGIYDPEDWGPFGAFVIAPVGCVIFSLMFSAVRIGFFYALSKYNGSEFTALDRPIVPEVVNDYGSINSQKKSVEEDTP